jgi:hypothetical protein
MPLSAVRTQHRLGQQSIVMAFRCDVCGREACYGYGGSIRAAMTNKDASKGGQWFCREHHAEYLIASGGASAAAASLHSKEAATPLSASAAPVAAEERLL